MEFSNDVIRPFAPLTLSEKIHQFILSKQAKVIGVVGLVAVIAGYMFFTAKHDSPQAIAATSAATFATTTAPREKVKVYVTGAVNTPGVVEIDKKARVIDAIKQAGDATAAANVSLCNLAAFVVDGQTINVPSSGANQNCSGAPVTGATDSGSGTQTGTLVSLNTSSQTEIESLPGVGPALASAIISYRNQHGFSSVSDLRKVKGIGDKRFDDLKDLVTL
jgi:competence protein ComEA